MMKTGLFSRWSCGRIERQGNLWRHGKGEKASPGVCMKPIISREARTRAQETTLAVKATDTEVAFLLSPSILF